MKTIRKIEKKNVIKRRLKVAAYARVSLDTDMLRHSLSQQVSYYNQLIQSNKEWEFAGIFADQGISGTNTEKRDEFNRMFKKAKAGETYTEIAKAINKTNIKTRNGMAWNQLSIKDILRQEKYAGFSILQKRFIEDPLTHKNKRNKGELPQYIAEGTHPAIIKREDFDKAQKRIAYITGNKVKCHKQSTWLTGLVKCPICGRSMVKISNTTLCCRGNRALHNCVNRETLLIKDLEKITKDIDLEKVDRIIFKRVRTGKYDRSGHKPGDNNFDRKITKGDFEIKWKS